MLACDRLPLAQDEFIYFIKRARNMSDVLVWLSDAYTFGMADYLGRHQQVKKGDFILIARPESGFTDDVLVRARQEGIAIGKIGKLMGALNLPDMSKYFTLDEKEQAKKAQSLYKGQP